MDLPDSTEPNLNLSDFFCEKADTQYEGSDALIQEFFMSFGEDHRSSAVEADKCENGNKQGSTVIDKNTLPGSPEVEEEIRGEVKSPGPIIGQVASMIEKLKQQSKELKEKNLIQECELVKYEERLSEKMHALLLLEAERDTLKESLRITNEEKMSWKSKVEEKEAELKQFKGLLQKQFTVEDEVFSLKKDLSNETKSLRKAEKDLQHSSELVNKKNRRLRVLKTLNKRIMVTLQEFGEMLSSKELLTTKQRKNLDYIIQHFQEANLDSEDLFEASYSSQDEENSTENHWDFQCRISGNAATPLRIQDIKTEDTSHETNGYLEPSITNGYLEPSTVNPHINIKTSPNSVEPEDIHFDSSLNKTSNTYQSVLNLVSCKVEETSNSSIQNDHIVSKVNNVSPDSNTPRHIGLGTESVSSDDMEITDEFCTQIMGTVVYKVENWDPISPIPPSPKPESNLHLEKIKQARKEDSYKYIQLSSRKSNIIQNDMSPSRSFYNCKRNILSHQASSGFEPHIVEKQESISSSNNHTSLTSNNLTQTSIPSNLHYICSTYCDDDINNYKILHQGSSVYDYLVNPENKLSVCVLTVPKSNSFVNNVQNCNSQNASVLPSKEERMKSVLSLYYATENRVTSIKKEILESSQDASSKSENNHLSHICVFVDGKSELINSTCSLENNSSLSNSNQSCLPIEGQSQDANQVQNEVSESVEHECEDNHSFVSSSCDVSPSKRNISKSFKGHNASQKKFNDSKGNVSYPLPIILNTIGNYSSEETSHFSKKEINKDTSSNPIEKPAYSTTESSCHLSDDETHRKLNTKLQNPDNIDKTCILDESFTTYKNPVAETSYEVHKSSKNSCSSGDSLSNDAYVPIFENTKAMTKMDDSSPMHQLSFDESRSESENMRPIITSVTTLQKDLLPVDKQGVLAEMELNSPFQHAEDESCNILFGESKRKIQEEKKLNFPAVETRCTEYSPLNKELHLKREDGLHSINGKSSVTDMHSIDDKSCHKKQNVISPFKIHIKNELSESVSNDSVKNLMANTIELSPKISEVQFSQSQVYLTDCSNENRQYGTFVSGNMNKFGYSNEEKNILLNVSDADNLEKTAKNEQLIKFKSKKSKKKGKTNKLGKAKKSGLLNTPLKKKKKNRKKNKKVQLEESASNSLLTEKSFQGHKSPEASSKKKSPRSKIETNSITDATFKQPLQNDIKISPCVSLDNNIKKIEEDSNYLQNDSYVPSDCETPTTITSDVNVCSFASPKHKSDENNKNSLSVQADVHCNKSFKIKNETSVISGTKKMTNGNICNSFVNDPLNASLENKNSEMNPKDQKPSSNFINMEQESSATNMNLSVKSVKNDIHCKDEDTVIYSFPCQIDSTINAANPAKETSTLNQDKSAFSTLFEKSDLNNSNKSHIIENEILHDNLPVDKASNSVENVIPLNNSNELINSQIEGLKVNKRRDSYQSNISFEENPLVIAEDMEESKLGNENVSENHIENSKNGITVNSLESPLENSKADSIEIAAVKTATNKSKQKKRKSSRTPDSKKQKKCKELPEVPVSLLHSIPSVLDEIRRMKIGELQSNHSQYKLLVHSLISALINPSNAPNAISALHQVFTHVSSSKSNPLLSYLVSRDISLIIPPAEKCIAEALIKVESKKKNHLKGLISSAINTLYYLILDKKTVQKTGLGAFCRIFTQLCNYTTDNKKPIMLCCDLIKEKHPFAPYLIASVVGVWSELFAVKRGAHECELLLLSAISSGLQKKPPTLTSSDWKQCRAIFNKYLEAVSLPDMTEKIMDMMHFLKEIVNDLPSEKDRFVTEQLVIFSAVQGWDWAREHIVINNLIPQLITYTHDIDNERAFSLLCDLCADIGKMAPDDSVAVLEALSRFFMLENAFGYVRKCAGRCLLKVMLFKKISIPDGLNQWIQENANDLGSEVEIYLRRRCIADETDLLESDIF